MPMHSIQVVEMMKRCASEIRELKAQIARLQPAAEGYDTVRRILGLLPQGSQGYSEDLAYTLDKHAEELKREMADEKAAKAAPIPAPAADAG
jgi:hypothetical protein